MRAMILAAGLGTRLRPLTNDRPKALVTVGGRTLLEITLARLRSFGIGEVIVNAHHFAEQIEAYLRENGNFGMRIEVSREEKLLDTGGGLKKAAWFFANRDEPFLLHNVDVISMIDLGRMERFHKACGGLATLAVAERESSRYLLFDENGDLCGRRAVREGEDRIARAALRMEPLAFAGIHVISPRIFRKLEETGAFSIVNAYLRLAAAGERIAACRADGCYWKDLGRAENLRQAGEDLAQGKWAIV